MTVDPVLPAAASSAAVSPAAPALPLPTPFVLWRHEDPTEHSGEGLVATGVRWLDGRCTLRWQCAGPPPGYHRKVCQMNTFECEEDMLAVHGHGGLTQCVYRNPVRDLADLEIQLFALVTPGADVPDHVWVGFRPTVMFWGLAWRAGVAVTWRTPNPVPPGSSRPVPARIAYWPNGLPDLHLYHDGPESGLVSVTPFWLPDQVEQLSRMVTEG